MAEHIDASAQDVFLDNLRRHVRSLVLSWAVRGQGGHGHVNELDPADVSALLKRHRFVEDEQLTRLVRSRSQVWYIQRSVMVLHRVED